jgi:hypothetical protein
MRGVLLIAVLTCLAFSGCSGVSNSDKERMQIALHSELREQYQKAGFQIMFLQVELTNAKKNSYVGTEGKYRGMFKCDFTENDQEISFYGMVGFDKDMEISSMPEHYGDGKISIDIMGPYTIGSGVDTEYFSVMPEDCKYILNCFMNRNKMTGNE